MNNYICRSINHQECMKNPFVITGRIPEEYIPFVCKWFRVYQKDIDERDVQKVYQLFEGNT